MDKVSRKSGQTEMEEIIIAHLVEAWNLFVTLEPYGDWDRVEFMEAIHKAQGILALRVVGRDYPDTWRGPQ